MPVNFVKGFESLHAESAPTPLPLSGTLPEWLSGSLLRTGPSLFEIGKEKYLHWFDGLAMLHRFAIGNGEITYSNKFLQGNSYKAAMQTGKIVAPEFATLPKRSLLGRIKALTKALEADNAAVNVTQIAGDYLAITELPALVKFDPQTLQTKGHFTYGDNLSMQVSSAHPHYDFSRKLFISYGIKFSRTSEYLIFSIAEGSTQRNLIATLPVKAASYMHSFAITENYIILVEFPLYFNVILLGLSLKSFIGSTSWKPQEGTRFLVINKSDGKLVKTYQGEAFFSFHHINAYEENGDIVMDLSAYPDNSIIDSFYLDKLRHPVGKILPAAEFRRYRLPATGTHADYETLVNEEFDLPRINYAANNSRSYRYTYGASVRKDRPNEFFNQLVKVDVENRTTKTWYADDCYPGEPVFVAKRGADEDSGVLLSVVLDGNRGKSFLLVLDANTFEEIARAETPHLIPFNFHGQFFSGV